MEVLERRVTELEASVNQRRWYRDPAWLSLFVGTITAIVVGLWVPVIEPLFTHKSELEFDHASQLLVDTHRGQFADLQVRVVNPSSSPRHIVSVEALLRETAPADGYSPAMLCPNTDHGAEVPEGETIPAHDSLAYSAFISVPTEFRGASWEVSYSITLAEGGARDSRWNATTKAPAFEKFNTKVNCPSLTKFLN